VTAEGVADETPIQDAFRQLTEDEARNALIAEQALSALREGRNPVLLTERRKHLEWFQVYLQHKVERLVVLNGGMGQKKRRAAWDVLQTTAASGAPRLVLATGRYLGEGFDDASLDTLLLAMPILWKGTVAQYAGRLHRLYAGKQAVVIYDFVDDSVPVLARMFERRKRGYASLGYSLVDPPVPAAVS
jgi:superfamily II DNA or RNA helicase